MEELDLKELFTMFWNKRIHIILIIAIFTVLGVIYTTGFVVPKYTSTTTLLLAGQDSGKTDSTTSDKITTTDVTLNSKLVGTYSELVTSSKVVRQVISKLGIDISESQLKKSITVSSVKDTDVIEISVTNENPTYAMNIANEIANTFIAQIPEYYNISNVRVVDQAEVSNTPSNVSHTKDILIFIFMGIVVSVIYVLVMNMLDTTIKTREEVEKMLNIPVIAEIPMNLPEKGGKR